jgi:uncharacterized repeat protein (TIGR01451 family)
MSYFANRRALLVVIAMIPACAAPQTPPKLAMNTKQPAPLAESRQVQVLGEKPAKPIVGQPLPILQREGYEGPGCAPPLPFVAYGPFNPPGIKGPWPSDEYLHDGGDAEEPVAVSPEWRVQGLNVEDTVAHYDTLDGRTKVEPTNCTYVYAPRFSSVRSVVTLVSNDFVDGPNNMSKPVRPGRFDEREVARTNIEQLQPIGAAKSLRPGLYHRDQSDKVMSLALLPSNAQYTLLRFEDLSVIRTGAMLGAEKARLAEAADAAIVWTKDTGVRVFISKERAVVQTGDQRAQAIYTVKEPENGRLRICKIASTAAAQPGDFVEFTLRYDNVGDQVLGNIVILDSLTTRLEFVPGSAQSSRKAHFMTNPNVAESLELRWEIDEALLPGDGGIVRFRCKVR